MRIKRPSRFALVSLVIAIALGTGLNLLIAHGYPEPTWQPLSRHKEKHTEISSRYDWPTVPQSVIDEFGDPVVWHYANYLTVRSYSGSWSEGYSFIGVNYSLDAERLGFPWTARSTKEVRYSHSHGSGSVWPQSGSVFELNGYHPAVTYHPLGLILNPIIYALPIWLLVIGIRWAFIVRRSRKRERLGLCVGCAYELGKLSVCPECGRVREGRKRPSPA